jgi:uncharacterized phage protein (TIGR02220 family)
MVNIAPALYGQTEKYIQVWIYIYAHLSDGKIYTNEDVCKQCSISRQGLTDILVRGVKVFNEKGISISIHRETPTSKYFTLIHHGASIKERKPVPTPKKVKEAIGEIVAQNEFTENVIVTYLNEQTGKSYRSDNKETIKLIQSRLKDGFTVEQFKYVIDVKTHSWKNTEYEKYLRPQTLFGNKFETYLNETINDQPTNSTSAQRIRNAEAIIDQDWGVLPNTQRE